MSSREGENTTVLPQVPTTPVFEVNEPESNPLGRPRSYSAAPLLRIPQAGDPIPNPADPRMSPLARDVSRVPRTQLDLLMEFAHGPQSVATPPIIEAIIDHDTLGRPRRPPRHVPVSPARFEPMKEVDEGKVATNTTHTTTETDSTATVTSTANGTDNTTNEADNATSSLDNQNLTTESAEENRSVTTETYDSDAINNDTSSTTSVNAHTETADTISEPESDTAEQYNGEPRSTTPPSSTVESGSRPPARPHANTDGNAPRPANRTLTRHHEHVPSPKLYRSNTTLLPQTRAIVQHKSFTAAVAATSEEHFTNIVLKPVSRRAADSPTKNTNDGSGADNSGRSPLSPRGANTARSEASELHRGKSESLLQHSETTNARKKETRARSNSSPMKVIVSSYGTTYPAGTDTDSNPAPAPASLVVPAPTPASLVVPAPSALVVPSSNTLVRSKTTPPTTPTYASKPNVSFSLPDDKEGKLPTPTKKETLTRGDSANGLREDVGIKKREALKESSDSTREIPVPIRIEPVPGIVRRESSESFTSGYSSSKSSIKTSSSDSDSMKSSADSLRTSSESLKSSSEMPKSESGGRKIQFSSDLAKMFSRGSEMITQRSSPELATHQGEGIVRKLTRKISVDAIKDQQEKKKAREELLKRKASADTIQSPISKSVDYSAKDFRGGRPAVPARQTKKGEEKGETKSDSSPVGSAYSGALLSIPAPIPEEKPKESSVRKLFHFLSTEK